MIDDIESHLHATPFVPFSVTTSGGQSYRVSTPDHASISPTRKQIFIWLDAGGSITLAGLHITAIETEIVAA